MPFKSKEQKRFFGICKRLSARERQRRGCPSLGVINEFFGKTRKNATKKRKTRRK